MRDTWRVTLCQGTLLVASLQRRSSAITEYANFLVYMASVSSLYDLFPLFWIGNAPLHSQSHKLPHPPSPTRYLSAGEVIEVAGSNHVVGFILNLAWGPNNFSPSMIWSWRTRSNSQTGLGAE